MITRLLTTAVVAAFAGALLSTSALAGHWLLMACHGCYFRQLPRNVFLHAFRQPQMPRDIAGTRMRPFMKKHELLTRAASRFDRRDGYSTTFI
ncbi:MAG: hypothetical protein IH831_10320 [Planctomycetes bacterium]|nr:hypothetical protein [Planctomycetota bacterium]